MAIITAASEDWWVGASVEGITDILSAELIVNTIFVTETAVGNWDVTATVGCNAVAEEISTDSSGASIAIILTLSGGDAAVGDSNVGTLTTAISCWWADWDANILCADVVVVTVSVEVTTFLKGELTLEEATTNAVANVSCTVVIIVTLVVVETASNERHESASIKDITDVLCADVVIVTLGSVEAAVGVLHEDATSTDQVVGVGTLTEVTSAWVEVLTLVVVSATVEVKWVSASVGDWVADVAGASVQIGTLGVGETTVSNWELSATVESVADGGGARVVVILTFEHVSAASCDGVVSTTVSASTANIFGTDIQVVALEVVVAALIGGEWE